MALCGNPTCLALPEWTDCCSATAELISSEPLPPVSALSSEPLPPVSALSSVPLPPVPPFPVSPSNPFPPLPASPSHPLPASHSFLLHPLRIRARSILLRPPPQARSFSPLLLPTHPLPSLQTLRGSFSLQLSPHQTRLSLLLSPTLSLLLRANVSTTSDIQRNWGTQNESQFACDWSNAAVPSRSAWKNHTGANWPSFLGSLEDIRTDNKRTAWGSKFTTGGKTHSLWTGLHQPVPSIKGHSDSATSYKFYNYTRMHWMHHQHPAASSTTGPLLPEGHRYGQFPCWLLVSRTIYSFSHSSVTYLLYCLLYDCCYIANYNYWHDWQA